MRPKAKKPAHAAAIEVVGKGALDDLGAQLEGFPAGAPLVYAPDGLATPSRADGTYPRHLFFLASVRKPWSKADHLPAELQRQHPQ